SASFEIQLHAQHCDGAPARRCCEIRQHDAGRSAFASTTRSIGKRRAFQVREFGRVHQLGGLAASGLARRCPGWPYCPPPRGIKGARVMVVPQNDCRGESYSSVSQSPTNLTRGGSRLKNDPWRLLPDQTSPLVGSLRLKIERLFAEGQERILTRCIFDQHQLHVSVAFHFAPYHAREMIKAMRTNIVPGSVVAGTRCSQTNGTCNATPGGTDSCPVTAQPLS